MRVKATVSYDGSKFIGFQKQKNSANTIATAIELALKSLNIDSKIVGSGRTDKGVHATGQVINFDLPHFWQKKSLNELKTRLNQKLKYIKFKKIEKTDSNFHAQYSAKVRIYRYILKENSLTVFEKDYISSHKVNEFELFKSTLESFKGKHNFKLFKKEGSITSSDTREVYRVKVHKLKKYIVIYFYANGYLRSQVRLMVASALAVANSKIGFNDHIEQLNGVVKHTTKPADGAGLYLYKIIY